MRIISEFKDYYDSAQGYGMDPALTYVRKTEVFEYETRFSMLGERRSHLPRGLDKTLAPLVESIKRFPHAVSTRIGRWRTENLQIPLSVKLIGFCGFIYPAIEIAGKTFHSTEDIATGLTSSYLKRCGTNEKVLKAALERKVDARRGMYWQSDPLTHGTWLTASSEVLNRRFDPLFIDLGIPAFKLEYIALNKGNRSDRIRLTLNPFLKADDFQKVKDPAGAFQEISMYLGNQLARQPDPASDIPDEILRDEKGFDKWSFRRHKEEDKKYRKNKHSERQI
ncbi:MAG: hypothetical protein AMXMBFR82_04120 [Candidatus Hydrogenedentota bacterium]